MGANMNSSSNLPNLRQQAQQLNQEIGTKRNEQTQTQTQQTAEVSRLDASICQNFNKSSQIDQLVTNSQAGQATAEGNLATAQGNEATAQANSTTANDNLSTAQTNQSEAEAASTEAEAALSTATDEYNAAVDEVDIAQTEVDTANTNVSKAKSDLSAKQNENRSWWDKVKQAVKDAWNAAVNKLKSIVNKAVELYNKAKDKLKTALGMKADKERCMKVAEGVSDEAKAKLEERKQESAKAQELADAAAVIYAAAQGDTAVSQEQLDAAIKAVQDAQAQKEAATAEGQQLQGEKSAVQAEYDALLNQLSAAIEGKEIDLASLEAQINQLQSEIDTQNAQITIQEQLAVELGAQAMDLHAKTDAQTGFGALGNGIAGAFGGGPNGDLEKLEQYKAELEAAIMSGDQSKLEEIYAKVYSESGGKLTEEVMEEAVIANKTEDMLSDEDKEAIAAELKRQADALSGKFDGTVEGQGWLSEGLGSLNNGLGFGQTEDMTKAQIEEYQRQVDQLLKDLEEGKVDNFAARYKAITNESLNPVGADVLTMDADNKEDVAAFKEKYGLASDEEAAAAMKGMRDKTSNSRATEAIMDYESTQATMKEVTVGIAVGVVSAVAVIAAPFTGGASLAIGFAAGGLTKVALESSDALTSAEGKYSWQEGVLDFVSGGIDGAMTAATLGGAGLAGQGLKTVFSSGAKATVKQAGKTTLKEAFKGTAKSGGRAALTAMGSTTAHYVTDTVGTNALYDLSGGAQRTGGVQNEDGSTTYTVVDKTTGEFIRKETVRQGENGEEIVERSNDFSWTELGKQNLTSASTAFVGAGIGKFSGNYINPLVADKTGSFVLSNAAEIATDMTLSLSADYAIESIKQGGFADPEEFFTWDRMVGEGQNQIRGLLIGIATSKGNDPAAIAYSTAATKMASGADYDTVIKTMTDAGIPKQDATRFVANDAAQKIVSSGGDSNDAIKAMTDKGIDKAEAQSTVTKMEASSQAQKDFGTKGASQTKTDLMKAGYSENEAKNIVKDIANSQAQKAIASGNTDAAKDILTDAGYENTAADKIIEKTVGAQEAQEAYNNGTDVKTIKEDLKAKGYSKLEQDNFIKNMSIEKAQDSISKGDTEAASKALKDAGFSNKQIENSVAEWDAEAKAQIGTELKAMGYHENETNIQACYNLRKAGVEVNKNNMTAELGLKHLGIESNKTNIEAYGKLKDTGISINKENVELGSKLQGAGVEVTKDNMALGAKVQKTGAGVTKDNIEAYSKLGKAGIEANKDNIELGGKLQKDGVTINKENIALINKLQSAGVDIKLSDAKAETFNKLLKENPKLLTSLSDGLTGIEKTNPGSRDKILKAISDDKMKLDSALELVTDKTALKNPTEFSSKFDFLSQGKVTYHTEAEQAQLKAFSDKTGISVEESAENIYALMKANPEFSGEFTNKLASLDADSKNAVVEAINNKQINILEANNLIGKTGITDYEGAIKEITDARAKERGDLEIKATILTEAEQTDFYSALGGLATKLSEIEDYDFNNLEIKQEYSNDDFILKTFDAIKDLSPADQRKVCEYYGFRLDVDPSSKTGYTITGYPKNTEGGAIDISKQGDDVKKAVSALGEDVTKFSTSKVTTGNAEVDALLNDVLKGMPELHSIIGKNQHSTHSFDTMQHSLKVMQKVTQQEGFTKLSDSDQKLMLVASLTHDITKIEDSVDKEHPEASAKDVEKITASLNLTDPEKAKLNTLIEHHDWYEKVNSATGQQKGELIAKYTEAFGVGKDGDDGSLLEMAKIFTEADLKGVKNNDFFYTKYGEKLDSACESFKSCAEICKDIEQTFGTKDAKQTNAIAAGVFANDHDPIGIYNTLKTALTEENPRLGKNQSKVKDDLAAGHIDFAAAKVLALDIDYSKQGVTVDDMLARAKELKDNKFVQEKTSKMDNSTSWGTKAAHYANILRLDNDQYKRFNEIIAIKEGDTNPVVHTLDDAVRLAESDEAYQNAKNYLTAKQSGAETFKVTYGTGENVKTYEISTELGLTSTVSLIATNENYAKNTASFTALAKTDPRMQESLRRSCQKFDSWANNGAGAWKDEPWNAQRLFSLTETEYARVESILVEQAKRLAPGDGGAISQESIMRIARDEARFEVVETLFKHKSLDFKDVEELSILKNVDFNNKATIDQIINWKKAGYNSNELRFGAELQRISEMPESVEKLFAQSEFYKNNGFALSKDYIDASKTGLSDLLTKAGMKQEGEDYNFEKNYYETIAEINKQISEAEPIKIEDIQNNPAVMSELMGKVGANYDAEQIKALKASDSFKALSKEEQAAFLIASQIKTESETFDPYQMATISEIKLRAAGVDEVTAQNVRCILEEQYSYNVVQKLKAKGTNNLNGTEEKLLIEHQQRIAIFAGTEFRNQSGSLEFSKHLEMLNQISDNPKTKIDAIMIEPFYETVMEYNINSLPQSSNNNFEGMVSRPETVTRNGKTYDVKIIPVSSTVNSNFSGFVHGYGVTAGGNFSGSNVLTDFDLRQIDPTSTTSTSYLGNGNFNCDSKYGIVLEARANELLSLTPYDASFPTRISIDDLTRFYFRSEATALQGKTYLFENREYAKEQVKAYQNAHGGDEAEAVKAILGMRNSDQNLIVNQGSGFLNANSYNEALIKGGQIKALYIQKGAEIPDVYLELAEAYKLPIIEMDRNS